MNVPVQAPTLAKARRIAQQLYQGIRAEHDWGRLFEPEPRMMCWTVGSDAARDAPRPDDRWCNAR